MRESFRAIFSKYFEGSIEYAEAKTGREAIEMAENFHPDIVFMDIRMPGIDGITAIREIRAFNQNALFYVISAYDKFDYAKEAISLGVEGYLMKPISRQMVIDTVREASGKVDRIREERHFQLKIQEKLQTVIPVVETGYVSAILLSDKLADDAEYRDLLEIHENYAYAEVFCFGAFTDGKLLSTVRSRVHAQESYPQIRAVIKSFQNCIIGPVLSDRIIVFVPHAGERIDYEERISIIDLTQKILTRLKEQTELDFRLGIGKLWKLESVRGSCQEASESLLASRARICHADDCLQRGNLEGNYPITTEQDLFDALKRGEVGKMQQDLMRFFSWLSAQKPEDLNSMRLKCLEFVMRAERMAFDAGAVDYAYTYRKDYLSQLMGFPDAESIWGWLLEKMTGVCAGIRDRDEKRSESTVARAQKYIKENFTRDISLDDVSREVNVSPYYFSRLFKAEVGENFIEYLTGLRIAKARDSLRDPSLSIKEIGIMSGYGDPNYFSRIFKKQTGQTPREYRESLYTEAL